MAKIKYDSSSIKTWSGLEAVREVPAMYIGATDSHGLFLILRELLDNAVDEYLAGRATAVQVYFGDNCYWVHDNGTGVPQGIKKVNVEVNGKTVVSKVPTMQSVFGTLHTSGKHSDAYKASRGVHGIGAKATNALSVSFKVWTKYEGEWYHIAYKKGKLDSKGVVKAKPPKSQPFEKVKGGTLIYFEPDFKIFTQKKFAASMILEWSEITTYLSPKFRVSLFSAKSPDKPKVFYSERGPKDYIDARIESLKVESLNAKTYFEAHNELADVVVAFTNFDGSDLRGYTNGLYNHEGGTHVSSIQNGLLKALKPYARKKQTFTAHEFRDGLLGIVNAKLSGAQFSSQEKVRLTDRRLSDGFEEWVYKEAKKFFEKNKKLAMQLCDRAAELAKLKDTFKASKKALKNIAKAGKRMPTKYAPAHKSTKVADRELFLVEGDSAGGPMKLARFAHQAVLPLKGKIMNAMRAKGSKALESDEVAYILGAIGFNASAKDPYSDLKVGKIICLADPDPDGPFEGQTLIDVVADDRSVSRQPIETLIGNEFKTYAWSGAKVVPTSATVKLVRHVTKMVALEIGGTKYKCDEDHKWPVLNYKQWEITEGSVVTDESVNLFYKRAADLRCGDRVLTPASNTRDKNTGFGYTLVSKHRIQQLKEPTPVYCLTVKQYHNFILPSGQVSANCHINALLLTLFFRYMPRLFELGLIYVADCPEFYSEYKDELVTGSTVSEVKAKLTKIKAPASTSIHHLKGWGEAEPYMMVQFATDAKTRRLIKIEAAEGKNKVEFTALMNDDVAYRKQLLGV